MGKLKIGLLHKKRGHIILQEKSGNLNVEDPTQREVAHHESALYDAGYDVEVIKWGPDFINDLMKSNIDMLFNVSSMIEATIAEELEIPYVGSDTITIAKASDKAFAKRIWDYHGIPTAPFFVAKDETDCIESLCNNSIEFPLFVKPIRGRGSAGITKDSKVNDYQQLVSLVEWINQTFGQEAIVEEFLEGREITLGVLGNYDNIRVLPSMEVQYSGENKFLTFHDKRAHGNGFLCPAQVSIELENQMQDMAITAYKTLGFKDFGRFDMILTEKGPYLLEGNTFAGLSCTPKENPQSYIGVMTVFGEGRNGEELLDEIVTTAAKRQGINLDYQIKNKCSIIMNYHQN